MENIITRKSAIYRANPDIKKISENHFSTFACKSSLAERKKPEQFNEKIKTEFSRDSYKIINSLAYSRYVGKTQVFALFDSDHISRRIIHVQLVSKIGRLIGKHLDLNCDLIEAIALGHDIGHAPYGHDGEEILNEICVKNKIGCFCHNAQSVKFLNEIENQGNGLNLSLQVLDGILSHHSDRKDQRKNGEMLVLNYEFCREKTFEQFEKEYKNSFDQRDFVKTISPMTFEACVVKISDIIAYLGKDVEDAIILKIIKRKEIPLFVKKNLGDSNLQISESLISDLIKNSIGKDHLFFSERIFKAFKDLIVFNYKNIYLNPRIKTELPKIKRAFFCLFEKFLQDLKNENKKSNIFKHFLNDIKNENYRKKYKNERIVIDYIASMTDRYFGSQYKELFFPKNYSIPIKYQNNQ